MSNEYMLLPFTHPRYYLREQGLNECTCKTLHKEKHFYCSYNCKQTSTVKDNLNLITAGTTYKDLVTTQLGWTHEI